MIIGGIVSFIVSLLIHGHALEHPHILQAATVAAGAWISAVLLVWGGVKVLGKRSRVPAGGAPFHFGGGHFLNASSDSDHSRVFIAGGTVFLAGIVIGATFGSRGNWSSADTSLIVVGGIALWRGITMLKSSPS